MQSQKLRLEYDLTGLRAENSLKTLVELIQKEAGIHLAEEITVTSVKRWLHNQKLVLILDGFDEIHPVDRDTVYEWIMQLQAANEDCSIIVTTRPLTTNHIERFKNEKWKTWELLPFDIARIKDFIERWHKYNPALSAEKREVNSASLAKKWNSDPTIS